LSNQKKKGGQALEGGKRSCSSEKKETEKGTKILSLRKSVGSQEEKKKVSASIDQPRGKK